MISGRRISDAHAPRQRFEAGERWSVVPLVAHEVDDQQRLVVGECWREPGVIIEEVIRNRRPPFFGERGGPTRGDNPLRHPGWFRDGWHDSPSPWRNKVAEAGGVEPQTVKPSRRCLKPRRAPARCSPPHLDDN